jgi:hypothetical protein
MSNGLANSLEKIFKIHVRWQKFGPNSADSERSTRRKKFVRCHTPVEKLFVATAMVDEKID